MTQTVIHFTDSTGFGGAEQAMLHVLAGLDRRHWRPVLWHLPAPGIAPLLERASDLDIEVRAVPYMPLGRQGAARIPQFIRSLRAERPAVFHAHLTWPLACKHALCAAALAGIPAVIATEQLFVDLPYNRSTRIQQRIIATGVNCYIAVSCDIARRLHRVFRLPQRKIKVIPNAIPLNDFDRPAKPELRARFNGASDRPIVLSVARLDQQKGHSYLLEAASMMPEALFVLVGEGPERATIEQRITELGLDARVILLGYRQDVPDLLAMCDVFVLPSLYEGLPLSILEAMAAGKPVIASAIGGTDEAVVHGETGLLVPPAQPQALAHAIRRFLADPALAHRTASAGKQRVYKEFSAEVMTQRITAIYNSCLGM